MSLESKLSEMAEKCTEWHGCASGDCPHDTYRECFNAVHKEGAKAALSLPELAELYKVADQCLSQWKSHFEGSNCEDLETTLREDPLNVEAVILKESIEALKKWNEFVEDQK